MLLRQAATGQKAGKGVAAADSDAAVDELTRMLADVPRGIDGGRLPRRAGSIRPDGISRFGSVARGLTMISSKGRRGSSDVERRGASDAATDAVSGAASADSLGQVNKKRPHIANAHAWTVCTLGLRGFAAGRRLPMQAEGRRGSFESDQAPAAAPSSDDGKAPGHEGEP